jgi:hypothetical protein
MSRARRVYAPRDAAVEAGEGGMPVALAGTAVEGVREEWVVEDRWWTAEPLRRHYYELVLADGNSATVFRDMRTGRWHRQTA